MWCWAVKLWVRDIFYCLFPKKQPDSSHKIDDKIMVERSINFTKCKFVGDQYYILWNKLTKKVNDFRNDLPARPRRTNFPNVKGVLTSRYECLPSTPTIITECKLSHLPVVSLPISLPAQAINVNVVVFPR